MIIDRYDGKYYGRAYLVSSDLVNRFSHKCKINDYISYVSSTSIYLYRSGVKTYDHFYNVYKSMKSRSLTKSSSRINESYVEDYDKYLKLASLSKGDTYIMIIEQEDDYYIMDRLEKEVGIIYGEGRVQKDTSII